MDPLRKMLETNEQQGEQVHMQAQKSSPSEINLCQSKFKFYFLGMDVPAFHGFSRHS